jgi:6-phosphogluconolactonase (cycloisomerase 2 family)
MRIKFNKSGQLLLVSAASLLAAGFLSACATATVDFVYVASAKAAGSDNYGEIDVFEVNSGSGKMRQIPASPFPSGGRNPVAEAVSTDNTNLYVVNEDDNSIVQFVIGNDGKLYPQNTVNTPGVFPLAVAVSGKFLYVADTYQPLPRCSSASPCSGSVAVFPIQSNDSLGTAIPNAGIGASYWPLSLAGNPSDVIMPTALAVASSGPYLYVTAYDTTANKGYIFAFTANADGTLTQLGSSPFPAGTHPSALATDPTGSYVFVTDYANADVLAYQINAGALTPVSGSPFEAGNSPAAIVVDGKGKFAYVANSLDSNVSAYSINNGALTRIGSYTTGLQPVAIGIDPSINEYMYTANFLGNTVSGFQLNPNDGTLLVSQYSPFRANEQPTAIAAIPHGSHTSTTK